MDTDSSASRVLKRRLRKCTAALAREPQNPDIMRDMADILVQLDRRHEGLSCYHTAAQLYAQRGLPGRAAATCRQLLGHAPDAEPDDPEPGAHPGMEAETRMPAVVVMHHAAGSSARLSSQRSSQWMS